MPKETSKLTIFRYKVKITGPNTANVYFDIKKSGRPSKRLTIYTNNNSISNVEVERKIGKTYEAVKIDRINFHPTYMQTRLHSSSMIFPGDFKVSMDIRFELKQDKDKLAWNLPMTEPITEFNITIDELQIGDEIFKDVQSAVKLDDILMEQKLTIEKL